MGTNGFLHTFAISSDVETEVHYIAVLYHVVLAFDTKFAGFAHALLTIERYIVIILDDFRTDKAFFKVGVNNSCTLWCLGATAECPRTHFVCAGSKECLKVKQCVGSAY